MKISPYGNMRDDVVLTSIAYGVDNHYRFCVWVMCAAPSIFVIKMQSCTLEQACDWWHNVIYICMSRYKRYVAFLNEHHAFLNNCQKTDEIIIVEDITYQKLRNIMERTLPCHFIYVDEQNKLRGTHIIL